MAQTTFPLYPGEIPNSKPTPDEERTEISNGITIVHKISRPTITLYKPQKPNGTSVIIFPGGGYWINAIDHEGHDVAQKFMEQGVTAFVVKYRIPNDATMVNREIGPWQDGQQAIKVVRERAAEWNINSNRIGVMGFSAGGHLASTVATHYQKSVIENSKATSLRPDFTILIYPVISFLDEVGHSGSREQILGKNPSPEKIKYYSNELQVNAETPPAFLVHASDDNGVLPENSIRYYQALLKYKIPAELHLYQSGGHGFGMNNTNTEDAWMDRCLNWMRANKWL